MLGLYVHIPFCNHICYYCDFPKRVSNSILKEKYIESLFKEIKYYSSRFNDVDTVYIGGGTPSSLSIRLLKMIIAALPSYVKEFTIECNPNDINKEFLDLIKEHSVNRMSLGVQPFDDTSLKTIGRTHSGKNAINAIKLIKEYSFNLNVDLIYNIPGQSLNQVVKELEVLGSLDIDHISYYSLILEDKTIFSKMIKIREIVPNDIDIEAEMFEMIITRLKQLGYNHYEISNFAKQSKESMHNLIYWKNQEYIGIGMSAAGYLKNTRYQNTMYLDEYVKLVDQFGHSTKDKTILSETETMFNELMLGFRLLEGISVVDFSNRFKKDIFLEFPKLHELIKDGYLYESNGRLRLTKKGLFLNNEVLVSLL